MEIHIRPIEPDDAEAFGALMVALDSETQFMLFEPGERQVTAQQWRERIEAMKAEGESEVFIAEAATDAGRELVGFLRAHGQSLRRIRHSLYLVIGIRAAYTGRGFGGQLFAVMEAWARQRAIHRLHLTVMTHNERAIKLYKKLGFVIEGRHAHAIWLNGAYVAEYTMAKLLE
jgi:RimJ/RimL family protein N-acetyltransferase